MEYEHLEKVKGILGISGNFQDDTLKPLIYEVIEDMVDSGVNRTIAMSEKAIGAVAIGVNDIWNYTAGQVKHSPYFESRCIKLSYETPDDSQGGDGGCNCPCEPIEEITSEEIKELFD